MKRILIVVVALTALGVVACGDYGQKPDPKALATRVAELAKGLDAANAKAAAAEKSAKEAKSEAEADLKAASEKLAVAEQAKEAAEKEVAEWWEWHEELPATCFEEEPKVAKQEIGLRPPAKKTGNKLADLKARVDTLNLEVARLGRQSAQPAPREVERVAAPAIPLTESAPRRLAQIVVDARAGSNVGAPVNFGVEVYCSKPCRYQGREVASFMLATGPGGTSEPFEAPAGDSSFFADVVAPTTFAFSNPSAGTTLRVRGSELNPTNGLARVVFITR